MKSSIAFSFMVAAAGCAPAAPEEPTWVADVRPILAANCIRCHGETPRNLAPATFRLDVLEDIGEIKGARSMAEFIAARAGSRGDMPPEGPTLSGRQKAILEEWKFTTAAGLRPDNQPPAATVTSTPGEGDTLILDVMVEDPDRDLVHGELKSAGAGVAGLRGGGQRIVLDTSGLAPGERTLTAIVDDGGGPVSVELGKITVAHANTTPNLEILSPVLDDLVVAGQPLKVVFRAADPDAGDSGALRIDLAAVLGDTRVMLEEGVEPEPSGLGELEVDTGPLAEGDGWRIEATVRDGKASRVVVSPSFIVSHATTVETFESVRPIVNEYCRRCHSAHLPTGPNFDLLTELQRFRGRAWRKVFALREMPPKSMSVVFPELHLSDEDRARLSSWFYAGAPE